MVQPWLNVKTSSDRWIQLRRQPNITADNCPSHETQRTLYEASVYRAEGEVRSLNPESQKLPEAVPQNLHHAEAVLAFDIGEQLASKERQSAPTPKI
jgi:hypothetical protein